MARTVSPKVRRVTPRELERLLARARPLRDPVDTLTGPLRLLELDGALLVQETTDRGEHVVREIPDRDTAERLIEDRIDSYERMWDGCGCKIDYWN
jgi:hypothetical protein